MGHYSLAHKTQDLIRYTESAVDSILAFQKGKRSKVIPLIMYSGFSGSALGIAIAIQYYKQTKQVLHQMYVRKINEESHGSHIETDSYDLLYDVFRHNKKLTGIPKQKILPIFVDDFTDTGATRKYVVKEVSKYFTESVRSLIREGNAPSKINNVFYDVHDCFQYQGKLILSEVHINIKEE